MHLDKTFDGNSPFELYKKTEKDHFKLDWDEVVLADNAQNAKLPEGTGVIDIRFKKAAGTGTGSGSGGEQVLIDPMTKEIISKVAEYEANGERKLDESGNVVYKVNDHWFILNFKLIWKNAPAAKEPLASASVGSSGSGKKGGSGKSWRGGTAGAE
jgi:hypothetical protein